MVGHELGAGGAVEAHREQVRVLTDAQNASTVWPASMVPIGSMVTDSITGRAGPAWRRPARCRAAPPSRSACPARLEQQGVRAALEQARLRS